MKLPKPPQPAMVYMNATGHTTRCHNETQLIEYGIKCAEAMREACAAECETLARQVSNENFVSAEARKLCGKAIRALEIEV